MASEQQIEAVAFDLGGVLLDFDPRHVYRQLFTDPADMEEFLASVCTGDWHRAHDLGVDITQSCAELAAAHPEHVHKLIISDGLPSQKAIVHLFPQVYPDKMEKFAAAEAAGHGGGSSSPGNGVSSEKSAGGSLASDAQLAALREKLAGNA